MPTACPTVSGTDPILVRGIHVALTPALTQAMRAKAARLLRPHPSVQRIRLDLEFHDTRAADRRFTAKAHVEVNGPDLVASASSDDGYKSVDLVVAKLSKLLRERRARSVCGRNDERRQAPAVLHGKA